MPVNNSGGSRVPKKPSKNLVPDDFVYANEVANQPAMNRKEGLQKMQAQLDVKELKRKYPAIRKQYDVKGTTVSTVNKTYPA